MFLGTKIVKLSVLICVERNAEAADFGSFVKGNEQRFLDSCWYTARYFGFVWSQDLAEIL